MNKRTWVLALAWLLVPAGCGSKTTTTTTNITNTGSGAAHVANDLNGDGTADTATLAGMVVTAAGASFTVPEEFGPVSATVIDLGTEAVVAVAAEVVEDDLRWKILVYRDGALQDAGEAYIGGQDASTLPGDGTIRSTSANCGQSTSLTYKLDAGKLVKEEQTTGTYDETQCFACPYVYVETPTGTVFVGESLRNMVGPTKASEDALTLPEVAPGQREIVVTLAEVKPETTYLDVIALDFDGVRVAPSSGPVAALAADGASEVFDLGERRRFVFQVPAGFTGAPVLYARGYYVRH